ncbi:YybH family protein [Marinicella litoralis]|uniref:Ketosteroid isomerase-like protein n=1 Tax=Marinicella litoralis TaxID=644220 RepID=A0A4R6XV14_9GAMM|nr:DUF4440 domain-containing protein [Marinicella litoralis]TDR23852.1 ketosteroid isomerase-like protein [Marinicella litoralis]
MNLKFVFAGLFLTMIMIACQPSENSANLSLIDKARQETEAAENAGSVEDMRKHFADDIVMMGPNMPVIAGIVDVTGAMRGFFEAFDIQIKYSSEEIVIADDWAFDRGTFTQILTSKVQGGPPKNELGKYLWVYKRMSDGSWKQARVIWNSSVPHMNNDA